MTALPTSSEAAAYPRWQYRPAAPGYAKRERCSQCRQHIDTETTDFYKLWISLTTADDRHTLCGPCAEDAVSR